MNSDDRARSVKEHALALGFSAVGIADLSPSIYGEHFLDWLGRGMAGTMTYMHRQAQRRLEPATILPGAKRAVVMLSNYFTDDPAWLPGFGRVSKYARGDDYHEVLQPPLQLLVDHVMSLGDCETSTRAYVDAGPVPERELAQRAGLGWIGKNTMLINRKLGSFSFIATVLTNLDMTVESSNAEDRCGSCRRCIESCPTGAIKANRLLDSRRCISYLTIEHRGEIGRELQRLVEDKIFGCDTCQDVCPWNAKFASSSHKSLVTPDSGGAMIDLDSLIEMTPESFQARFGNSPLNRPGIAGMQRNARIAKHNLKAVGLDADLE